MNAYYIMTDWGPMKVSRGASVSSGDTSALSAEIKELKELINVLQSLLQKNDTSEIDTLLEVTEFLTNYTTEQTLKDSILVETEDTTKDEYIDVFDNN